MTHSKKQWLMIGLVILVVTAVIYYVFSPKSGKSVVTDRSQELFSPERGIPLGRDASQVTKAAPGETIETECYSFVAPEELSLDPQLDQDDNCTLRFTTSEFLGKLVISARPWQQSLSNHSGVILRTKKTETYQLRPIEHPQAEARLYLSSDDATAFVYKSDMLVTLAISQYQTSSEQVESLLRLAVAGLVLE